ncbi:transposase tc1 [Fusarium sp. NRRL 52700]|nr:transposase tc1 [Fusarium sp. NRRL 52700]
MLYNATVMWLIALQWKIDSVSASSRIESCADAAMPDEPAARYLFFEPLRRPGASVIVQDPAMEICRVFEWVTSHHSRSKEPTFLYLFSDRDGYECSRDRARSQSLGEGPAKQQPNDG